MAELDSLTDSHLQVASQIAQRKTLGLSDYLLANLNLTEAIVKELGLCVSNFNTAFAPTIPAASGGPSVPSDVLLSGHAKQASDTKDIRLWIQSNRDMATSIAENIAALAEQFGGGSTAYIPSSILTAKGDMLAYNGTDHVRLPVGTDGFAVVADSAQSSGVAYLALVHDIVFVAETDWKALGGGEARITITSNLTTTDNHSVIFCDTTLAAITVTLQDPATRGGKSLDIANIGLTGKAVTILPNGSETIQHASSLVVGNNGSDTLIPDDTNWWKL